MSTPQRPVPEGTSVIVCARNRPSMLRDTVAPIVGSDELPDEIVVVDQSDRPDPALAEAAAGHPTDLRYLHSDTVGLGRACNEGVAAARHDVLVFTHDDVVVAPSWFSALVTAAHDLGQRVVRCLRRWREPYGAVGELVYAAGLPAGCVGWWIGPGRRG